MPEVRLEVASLNAQVTVLNAMAHRLANGPYAPFENQAAHLRAQLFYFAAQVVDTNTSSIRLFDTLIPHLPEQIRELRVTMERNVPGFDLLLSQVQAVHTRENAR